METFPNILFPKTKIYRDNIIFMALFSLSFKLKISLFIKEICHNDFRLFNYFYIHVLFNILNKYHPKIIGIAP